LAPLRMRRGCPFSVALRRRRRRFSMLLLAAAGMDGKVWFRLLVVAIALLRFCWLPSCVILLSGNVFALWLSLSFCVRLATFLLMLALARRNRTVGVAVVSLALRVSRLTRQPGHSIRCFEGSWIVCHGLGSCLGSWSRFPVVADCISLIAQGMWHVQLFVRCATHWALRIHTSLLACRPCILHSQLRVAFAFRLWTASLRLRLNRILHFAFAPACCICILDPHLHVVSAFRICVRVPHSLVHSHLAPTFPIRLSLLYCLHTQGTLASRLHVAPSDAFSRACPIMATRRTCGV
jgi:hypothetical protein